MIQNVLSGIGGVGLYGVLSICIFVGVFVAVIVWMITLRAPYLKSMRELPLADDAAPDGADSQTQSPCRHE